MIADLTDGSSSPFVTIGCFEYSGINKTASLIGAQVRSQNPSPLGRAEMGPLASTSGSNLAFSVICTVGIPTADSNYERRSSLGDDLYQDRIASAGAYSVSSSVTADW